MKNKLHVHFCFLVPFVITALNAQVLITFFISQNIAQVVAYGNLGLILLGTILVYQQKNQLSKTASLWIIFYLIYFAIGISAGSAHNNDTNILLTTIPFIYTVGFYYYCSIEENRKLFEKVAMASFVLSCIICIYWKSINFDLDAKGLDLYGDRAQGVYADANNMALVTILAFIFVFKVFKPSKTIFKIIRLILLAITAYSLFLTFSNTGFMAFIISAIILNLKFFKGARILLAMILLPLVYGLLLNLNAITANINLVGQQRAKINNIVNIVSLDFDNVDDSGRSELQHKVMEYVYENPIFGNGIDFANAHQAHNTYMAVWADAGFFAIVFFLFMLFKHFARALKSPLKNRFFVIALLINLSIFMWSLHSVINQPYIMAVFMYICYIIDKNKRENFHLISDNQNV